jgi:hypothetical protein
MKKSKVDDFLARKKSKVTNVIVVFFLYDLHKVNV